MSYSFSVLILVVLCGNGAWSLDNGLALTPPLGWMAWQRYRCIIDCVNYPDDCISEHLIKRTADLMVSEGYLAAGYEYINIDDCWLTKTRDSNTGRMLPDPDRFPSGMKALADYVHGKGLKFGMYQDLGNYTCGGYPGVLENPKLDAETFAEWEIDYLKLDGCYHELDTMEKGYTEFGKYLNETGRPIVYSCSWPAYQEGNMKINYEALVKVCNLWRNYGDIDDSWESVRDILDYFKNGPFVKYAGPGHWNDPDMIVVGDYGLSYDQSKTQMALWAILAAPLFLSSDLATIKPEYKAILQNRRILEVNQDPLGHQGELYETKGIIEIWRRQLSSDTDPNWAIALHNPKSYTGAPILIKVTLKEIGINGSEQYSIENLYDEQETETQVLTIDTEIQARVNPTGVVLLRATPIKRKIEKILPIGIFT